MSTERAIVGRHVLQPIEVDILEPPAEVDGLVHGPALVDVAHEIDVRADRLADPARAFDLDRRCRLARESELHLHLPETLLHQRMGRLRHVLQRKRAHERAACVRGHTLAQATQERGERLVESLALDIPKRHVDRGEREREDPAWSRRACRRLAQLLSNGLDAQRILAKGERGELLDCVLQGCGERRPEEGDADALDSRVGFELEGDKLADRAAEGRTASERLVGR
jgi:hypothetical protein